MRVSLINVGLRPEDAIGVCILNQVRFFQERGDDVRVYLDHAPENVSPEVEALTRVVTLKELLEAREEHFSLSDLYVYHYPARYPLMETIRGIERGTVVFYYHNVTPPELWGTEIGRERLVEGVEGSMLAHYADLVITDSPFNKEDLVTRLGYAPERIYVLPLAVDLVQFVPGDPDPELVARYGLHGQRVLVYVGRMAGNKRVDLLVEALARIQEQEPESKLLLVGDSESNPAFRPIVAAAQARAKELGVEEDVIWAGRVEDVAAHIRLGDVLVTASQHEGFGVPLIEAMSSGVPVVASRSGAMPWVLGGAGLECEPGDAGDLAVQVLSVLQDEELRQALIQRGLERVEAFTSERYVAGLAEILDKVRVQEGAGVLSLPGGGAEGRSGRQSSGGSVSSVLLEMLADSMEANSDVAMREYVVRSGVPLVGPLIVWLRRNLTSHLRGPYIDPIVERQVRFNRRVTEWVGRATEMLGSRGQRQQELEARIEALEARIEGLDILADRENVVLNDGECSIASIEE